MFRYGHVAASRLIPLLILACGSGLAEPPARFPYAAATRDCGPADGPAVTIYLSRKPVDAIEPSGTHVQIHVWQGIEELAGTSWSIGGDAPQGSAVHIAARGGFRAAWFSRTVTCG
jgi:hypothetical protein